MNLSEEQKLSAVVLSLQTELQKQREANTVSLVYRDEMIIINSGALSVSFRAGSQLQVRITYYNTRFDYDQTVPQVSPEVYDKWLPRSPIQNISIFDIAIKGNESWYFLVYSVKQNSWELKSIPNVGNLILKMILKQEQVDKLLVGNIIPKNIFDHFP